MSKRGFGFKNNDGIESAEVFQVDQKNGLTNEQIQKRFAKGYVNKTRRSVTKTYPRIIFDNLFSVLNLILFAVFGFMVSAKLSITSYVFMVILVANITIGIIQDIKARKLVDSLRVIVKSRTTVIREGKEIDIPSDELVLSDLTILTQGNQISADSKVVSGSVFVDESILTGESFPVKKDSGDSLFAGSFVTRGTCIAEVMKVGKYNYAETIQKEASKFVPPKSEIKKTINAIILFCTITAIVFGAASWLTYFFVNKQSYKDFIASFSGSMVAMIPAGMVLLTSLTLAAGVIALSKRRMLVQKLYCIEMLARVDCLCLDKTGTLTDGLMNVDDIEVISDSTKEEISANISSLLFHCKDTNLTAKALIKSLGVKSDKAAISILPFDPVTKYSAVTLEDGLTICIGAFGFVKATNNDDVKPIVENFSSKGFRCLVYAESTSPIQENKVPDDLFIKGIVVMIDHIKDDAIPTIKWFQDNGVKVRIISGDNALTVSEIAKRVGLNDAENYVSLAGKSLEETAFLASSYSVFGRVSPEQKAVLISSFKKQGSTVAMTGDGVNDILALKLADCSIAMANGADAAKNVSHLVSLDSDFSKLPDVVAQGRRVINNLQRTCSLFLCKTLFAIAMTFVFLVISWANHNASYPYTTKSLLVWEILSIGLPAFFLALQPSNEKLKGSFMKNILVKAIPGGTMALLAGAIPLILNLTCPNFYASANTYEVAKTISVLSFTFVSFAILFSVCLPFDKYRFFVFIIMTAVGMGLLVADYFLKGGFFGLHWADFKPGFAIVLLGNAGLCIVVYYFFDRIFRKYILGEKR